MAPCFLVHFPAVAGSSGMIARALGLGFPFPAGVVSTTEAGKDDLSLQFSFHAGVVSTTEAVIGFLMCPTVVSSGVRSSRTWWIRLGTLRCPLPYPLLMRSSLTWRIRLGTLRCPLPYPLQKSSLSRVFLDVADSAGDAPVSLTVSTAEE